MALEESTDQPPIGLRSGGAWTLLAARGDIGPEGEDVTIRITPSAGYYIADVSVDDVSRGPFPIWVFAGVDRDRALQGRDPESIARRAEGFLHHAAAIVSQQP